MKKTKKKFQPIFAPSYVQVIGVDGEGIYHKLQIQKDIRYYGNEMQIFVRLPK
jgi:hypothetical protein